MSVGVSGRGLTVVAAPVERSVPATIVGMAVVVALSRLSTPPARIGIQDWITQRIGVPMVAIRDGIITFVSSPAE